MHSGFPSGRSKQTIMTSLNDVTMISHATLGGNYKRRAHQNLRAFVVIGDSGMDAGRCADEL